MSAVGLDLRHVAGVEPAIGLQHLVLHVNATVGVCKYATGRLGWRVSAVGLDLRHVARVEPAVGLQHLVLHVNAHVGACKYATSSVDGA